MPDTFDHAFAATVTFGEKAKKQTDAMLAALAAPVRLKLQTAQGSISDRMPRNGWGQTASPRDLMLSSPRYLQLEIMQYFNMFFRTVAAFDPKALDIVVTHWPAEGRKPEIAAFFKSSGMEHMAAIVTAAMAEPKTAGPALPVRQPGRRYFGDRGYTPGRRPPAAHP